VKHTQTRGIRGRALVLQHHPDEHPGSLGPLLEHAGLILSTVELDAGEPIPALDSFDVLLVMGGPQQVWEEDEHPWLADEKAVIRNWVGELRRPFLGVCLGHQLLADAMGGRVERMEIPEIGVSDVRQKPEGKGDSLFGGLPSIFPALQWHEAEVVEPPGGATVLAENPSSAIQALRVDQCALGLQFHVEVGPDTIPKWAAVPEYERTLAAHFGTADALERAVKTRLGEMSAVALGLVNALLEKVFDARVAP
jgi:GMP synthase-like glutamine amidotransferase